MSGRKLTGVKSCYLGVGGIMDGCNFLFWLNAILKMFYDGKVLLI